VALAARPRTAVAETPAASRRVAPTANPVAGSGDEDEGGSDNSGSGGRQVVPCTAPRRGAPASGGEEGSPRSQRCSPARPRAVRLFCGELAAAAPTHHGAAEATPVAALRAPLRRLALPLAEFSPQPALSGGAVPDSAAAAEPPAPGVAAGRFRSHATHARPARSLPTSGAARSERSAPRRRSTNSVQPLRKAAARSTAPPPAVSPFEAGWETRLRRGSRSHAPPTVADAPALSPRLAQTDDAATPTGSLPAGASKRLPAGASKRLRSADAAGDAASARAKRRRALLDDAAAASTREMGAALTPAAAMRSGRRA
jgi:hypothetical protein